MQVPACVRQPKTLDTATLEPSERSAARLAHQSGGLGVPSSNLGAPTTQDMPDTKVRMQLPDTGAIRQPEGRQRHIGNSKWISTKTPRSNKISINDES